MCETDPSSPKFFYKFGYLISLTWFVWVGLTDGHGRRNQCKKLAFRFALITECLLKVLLRMVLNTHSESVY